MDPDIEARLHEIAQVELKENDSTKIKRIDSSLGKDYREFRNIDTNEQALVPVLPVFEELYPDESPDMINSIIFQKPKTPRKRKLRSGKTVDLSTPPKQYKYHMTQSPFRKFGKKKSKKLWERL